MSKGDRSEGAQHVDRDGGLSQSGAHAQAPPIAPIVAATFPGEAPSANTAPHHQHAPGSEDELSS
jgi:hypothetical protein